MTDRVMAFREGFYRACRTDLAKIRFLNCGTGFLALSIRGEPLTYDSTDPESVGVYLEYCRRYLGLNMWEGSHA